MKVDTRSGPHTNIKSLQGSCFIFEISSAIFSVTIFALSSTFPLNGSTSYNYRFFRLYVILVRRYRIAYLKHDVMHMIISIHCLNCNLLIYIYIYIYHQKEGKRNIVVDKLNRILSTYIFSYDHCYVYT